MVEKPDTLSCFLRLRFFHHTELGVLILMALVCFALIFLPPVLDRLRGGQLQKTGPTPSTEAAQPVEQPIELTSTSAFVESSATLPVLLPASATSTFPPPTSIPASDQLLIVRGQGNDSVIVVNQSVSAFPLELLSLGDDKQGIDGPEWGVVNLESGACVGVWKENEGNARYRPEDLNCRIVGNLLLRDRRGWFGEKLFVVIYDRVQFGVCEKNQGQCLVTIAP
jgi:hypothetical protein